MNPVARDVPGGGKLDHVVLGVSDSETGTEFVADLTGVRALPPSWETPLTSATRSVAISLGGQRFLEIYAPNAEYEGPPEPMANLLATLEHPRLLAWFVRVADLDAASRVLIAADEEFRNFMDVSRADAPSFRNGHLPTELFNPSIPFLIEWRDRRDMDARMARGCELVAVHVRSKSPNRTRAVHALLGINMNVELADTDAVVLQLATPNGDVEL